MQFIPLHIMKFFIALWLLFATHPEIIDIEFQARFAENSRLFSLIIVSPLPLTDKSRRYTV